MECIVARIERAYLHREKGSVIVHVKYCLPHALWTLPLLLFATGCRVNTPASPGGPVSFAAQIQPIFDAECSYCHHVDGFANRIGVDMLLTPDATPQSLINQSSSLKPALTLVIPGDAADSLLFRMVSERKPPVGFRMPLFSSPLSSEDLGLLRDWINQGALDN